MKKCDYGCDREALYIMKNGKQCCSKHCSSCPSMKIKNRGDKLGKIPKWKNGHPRGMSGKKPWNIGKTYEELWGQERADKYKEKIRIQNTGKQGSFSKMSHKKQEIYRERHREAILRRYKSGWMPKAGRCKKIVYESKVAGKVLVDGTWELAVAKYLDSLGVEWRRNKNRFGYLHPNGKESFYTPDFYVKDWDSYIEVKGYETDLDRCKWSQFQYKLEIWKKEKIKPLLENFK